MGEQGSDFRQSGTSVEWMSQWHSGTTLVIFCGRITLCGSFVGLVHLMPPFLPLLSGPDLRAGSGTWRIQEHPEWPSSLWERAGRPRQIQDSATDQAGQHQAEDRRVWSFIRRLLAPSATCPFWMVTTTRSSADAYQHTERNTLKLTNTHISCRVNWCSIK